MRALERIKICFLLASKTKLTSSVKRASALVTMTSTRLASANTIPACIATGATIAEIEQQIREAIEFHLDGMREDGTPIPAPASRVEYVDIAA